MTKRLCPICAKGQLVEQAGDFTAQFPDEKGEQRELVVPGVSWLHCDSCGEDILDELAEQKISTAQRTSLGLLSADQIRQLRKSLGKSQTGMSELLGIGEKTYCRWESGSYFQTEAFDRYLRLLIDEPSNVAVLMEIVVRKSGDEGGTGLEPFGYIGDLYGVQEREDRYLAAMATGTLQCPLARVN